MNIKYKANRHSVYSLKYHLVLTTKYRHQCINDELFEYLKNESERLFNMWNVELLEVNHDKDHVHFLLEIPPQVQISKLINNYKTVTSRLVKKNFNEYLSKFYWKESFWNRSYLILSSGGSPIETIKKYIQNQGS